MYVSEREFKKDRKKRRTVNERLVGLGRDGRDEVVIAAVRDHVLDDRAWVVGVVRVLDADGNVVGRRGLHADGVQDLGAEVGQFTGGFVFNHQVSTIAHDSLVVVVVALFFVTWLPRR